MMTAPAGLPAAAACCQGNYWGCIPGNERFEIFIFYFSLVTIAHLQAGDDVDQEVKGLGRKACVPAPQPLLHVRL